MADKLLTLRNGISVSPTAEIFPRNSAGLIGPRLGVVGDIVPTLNCYRTVVVEKRDEERIIDAIRGMLTDDRLQDLKLEYEAIVDTFQTYVDDGDVETLSRTKHLCTESASRFRAAFEKALREFSPYHNRFNKQDAMETALKPLQNAGDAYLIVLSIGFHSRAIRTPTLDDSVVLPKIEAALELLEEYLQRTLLPGGRVKGSPMASLLLRGRVDSFLYYYPHCKGYTGEAGIVKMTAEANETTPDKYWEGYKASSDVPELAYYSFADTLIEVISRFKKLHNIRLSFDPNASPLQDPRAILSQSESETQLFITQDPTHRS